MKSKMFTLLTIAAIPLSATAAPESAKIGIAIISEPAAPPAKEKLPERISTKFHKTSIADLGEAATKLKEQIQEKSFKIIPDPRTSRMFLMGSERAINQAIAMLDKMERE